MKLKIAVMYCLAALGMAVMMLLPSEAVAEPELSTQATCGFLVVFDNTYDKFNDNGYQGASDPMGNLLGGSSYDGVFHNGAFSVTGYNEYYRRVGTWTYYNANWYAQQVSLWGRVYSFSSSGQLFDPQYGFVGHIYIQYCY
jgi:hypothetical protein